MFFKVQKWLKKKCMLDVSCEFCSGWNQILILTLVWYMIVQGEDTAWVIVDLVNPDPSDDDWVAVYSPANFK